jgi:hypothetical protein
LQERRYAPYPKWLGTVFATIAEVELQRVLNAALNATDQAAREAALCRAYEHVARRHNHLMLTKLVEPTTGPFDVRIAEAVRAYCVLNAERFVEACREAIEDVALRHLEPVGAIDQLTHSSDLLTKFTPWPGLLASDYASLLGGATDDD